MTYEPPTTISPSRLQSFLTCPLKFKFQSLDGLAPSPTLAAIRGSIVHLALEYLYLLPNEERTVKALEGFAEQALDEYAQRSDFLLLELSESEQDKLRTDVLKLALNDFRMENPTEVETKGVELRLEVPLRGWVLRGVIDRLDVDGDGVHVVDYKTGRPPSQSWEAKSMMGVNLYALMCLKTYGALPQSVRLLYVRDLITLSSEPTVQTINALERKVEAIRKAIVKSCENDSFAAKKSALCNFCDYKQWCPAWGNDPTNIKVEFNR